jgi:large subunit ribosomal protein L4e
MKLTVKNTKNTSLAQVVLPKQFSEPIRQDLIKRAVQSLQSKARQPYGSNPRAGLDYSANISRRRRHYRGSYGKGISRVPRKVMSRTGTQFNWVGAVMPGTVGGRRAHPPKAWKIFAKAINKKENRKAIRSALAATLDKDLAIARGHQLPSDYPFALDNDFEAVNKTKDMQTALEQIGLSEDLARAKPTKVRAGIGKMRGRKTRRATSALMVFSKECEGMKSANNIPGIDAITVDELNAEYLAPGTQPGRMTLFTESAIKRLTSEKLFAVDKPKPVKEVKETPAKKDTRKKPVKAVKKKAKVEAKQ